MLGPWTARRPRTLVRFLVLVVVSILSRHWSRHLLPVSHNFVEWEDDIWPYWNQTPWDISNTSLFSYPRLLRYEVQEGTWLRLDVHPVTGDIVFDMVGDIYCLPASEIHSTSPVKARPVLLGIPHDSEPRFSPQGDRLVYRSDAGIGVENIWITPWKGCEEMNLRPDGSRALLKQEEHLLESRESRLVREGRHRSHRVTNETWRYLSNPRFHPSGTKVITSKWYTARVTLGAPEGWEYEVPSVLDLELDQLPAAIPIGSGKRILGRTLPPGKTIEDYGEQQIGPEQFIWKSEDVLIYVRNVIDTFLYGGTDSPDVHKGVFSIFSRNITTNKEETLVDAFPGGASRPELSRDGRTLAFVRRERDHEILVFKDLETGTLRHIWDGLTYDISGISNTAGSYPSYAFTPSDDAVIIWAQGQIYRVPIAPNSGGEKVAQAIPSPISFTAHIEKRLAETMKGEIDLVALETQDRQRVHAFKELRMDETGNSAVFQAAGVTVVQVIGQDHVHRAPVLFEHAPYYSPSFVPGSSSLILHSRWSDTEFTSFELADLESGTAYQLSNLPLGRYFTPVLSQSKDLERRIGFIKTSGDWLTGNIVATARPGLYIGDITLPSGARKDIPIRNLRFIASEINPEGHVRLTFAQGRSRLLVEQDDRAFFIELDGSSNDFDEPPHHSLVSARISNEVALSMSDKKVEYAAFLEFHHIYLAKGRDIDAALWAKPGRATRGLVRLTAIGGHDLAWSGDRTKLFWFIGPFIHSLQVSRLQQCQAEINQDPLTFGVLCVSKLVDAQEVKFEHSTDIARLKTDAASLAVENSDVTVIRNATLLTMATGTEELDLVREGAMVLRGGLIEFVGQDVSVSVPAGATVINADGGFVIPGFIDGHAHYSGYTTRYPAKSWEMETYLAYGVTTLHNPSADTVSAFIERSRLESGQFIGPRIFTSGSVLFSGTWVGLHEEIVDLAQAEAALGRIMAEAGSVSLSYKNYQLPSRASRQRLMSVGRRLGLLCVPEAGRNYDWDVTYIIDGMTTVEHSLPIPVLYDDVLTLWAGSGTAATPTHVVNYGGPWGEQLVWATEDLPNDPKLRRFLRHDHLEGLTESFARPSSSYSITNTSSSVAKMVRMGLKALIGAHGEPPLGLLYHAEMAFTKLGGLRNYEVLQAATSAAAQTLGFESSIGSLSIGKLADFLVYPPEVDLLDDLHGTRELKYVARGGRIWDASTMAQVWPKATAPQVLPPFNPD
ncbi:hypothetical protein C8J56DRAFT_267327 [Mycena floridula]|nr:hypothetical protein C8J56DRAFT_267327 [Mycena floridula]